MTAEEALKICFAIATDTKAPPRARISGAAAALPYLLPKLSAVGFSATQDAEPVRIRVIRDPAPAEPIVEKSDIQTERGGRRCGSSRAVSNRD
jgi:hypothetical protein